MFNHRESQLCVITLEDWKQIHQNYNLRLDYFDKNEISSKGNHEFDYYLEDEPFSIIIHFNKYFFPPIATAAIKTTQTAIL